MCVAERSPPALPSFLMTRSLSPPSIARTALTLFPFQVVLRIGEALFPLLLAIWFGRSVATDVYYLSWSIFSLAGSLLFSLYQDSALIPILTELKASDRSAIPEVLGSLLVHTLIGGGGMALAIGICSVGWFSLQAQQEAGLLAVWMVAPFCGYLIAQSLKTLFLALLQAEQFFLAAPFASGVSMPLAIALVAIFRHTLGVVSIPVGLFVGELTAALLLFSIARFGFQLRIDWTWSRPPAVVRFFRLVSSEVLGSAVTRINPVIDQVMAGLTGVIGGGTLLRYANDVATVPTSILQATLLPVLLSRLATDFVTGKAESIRMTVYRTLWIVALLLMLIALVLFGLRGPILRLIFLRGEMDAAGVDRMIHLFPYFLAGLLPFGMLLILVRAHIAIQNSSILFRMGIINASLNGLFNWILVRWMGLEGIALATGCVQMVVAFLLWMRLRKKMAAR